MISACRYNLSYNDLSLLTPSLSLFLIFSFALFLTLALADRSTDASERISKKISHLFSYQRGIVIFEAPLSSRAHSSEPSHYQHHHMALIAIKSEVLYLSSNYCELFENQAHSTRTASLPASFAPNQPRCSLNFPLKFYPQSIPYDSRVYVCVEGFFFVPLLSHLLPSQPRYWPPAVRPLPADDDVQSPKNVMSIRCLPLPTTSNYLS